ncbi:MAG: non-ribosomal peptide synthetase [Phycisphaerales bacterium]|nr:non-ribosomal peptide synthetase [Phycisphaerales bacterium]
MLAARDVTTFIGIHDAFSATIAGQHYDSIFVSGYGFAASYYGLPDVGFIAWTDMVALVTRLRAILPRHHILVDMDDGYGDPEIAAHVAAAMEQAGASGIVLEDQQRPRRCGHAPGKQVLPLDQYLIKLRRVLATRRELLVVARTDAADNEERIRRCQAFDAAGADAVLADGVTDLAVLTRISKSVRKPVMFNQIAGGVSPRCTLAELRAAGVSMVNYSTPCLFAAAEAIGAALESLKTSDGLLPDITARGAIGVAACTSLLGRNVIGPPREGEPATPPTIDERIGRLSLTKQRLLDTRRLNAAGAPGRGSTIPMRPAGDTAPLSRAQHWFWVAAELDPAGVSLNTIRGFRISGPLDVARLTAALAQVVRRHAILRTVYERPTSSHPLRQRILPDVPVDLEVIDLTGQSAAAQATAVQKRIIDDGRIPFRLSNGPVFRAAVVKQSPTDHLLTVSIHHIAFDGWSAGVLQQELADAYAAWPTKTPIPKLQYADYAAWQRSTESPTAVDADAAYWAKQLSGLTPIRLPLDLPRPRELSSCGARLTVHLPAELAEALRDLARAQGATLFMVLLTGLQSLLHRLSGQDDFVIGSHVAARDRVECEAMIGPFMNTLVLRARIDTGDSFSTLLTKVRATTVDALKHAAIPYDRLVRAVNPTRDPSRNPLYDIAFQLRSFPKPETAAGDIRFESVELDNGVARTDLQVLADERDGAIDLIFEYCTDLFHAATIQRMAGQYESVLRALSRDPSALVTEWSYSEMTALAPAGEPLTPASVPLTPTEQNLAGIWAEILDSDDFAADDNFFEVGGHSLRAVVCAAKVRQAFGVVLPVIAFFETPTLAGLSARIDGLIGSRSVVAMDEAVTIEATPQLSPGQQRLWFLNRYEVDVANYNVSVIRRLQGPLDAGRLERAINAVVRRHETLRTCYPAVDGTPQAQVVGPAGALIQVGVDDLSDLPQSEHGDRISAVIDEEAGRGFDVAVLPLLRARLVRTSADEHTLILTLHHIICDEWSIRLMLQEISAIYAADGDTLPALAQQYVQFAARQQAWLAGPAPLAEAAYWVNHLAEAPAVLALPTDRPRPAAQTFRGAHVPLTLSPDVVRKLKAIGRREQATDFMVTLALFDLLLARWSRQQDIVVGVPVTSRQRPEDQELIGYLLNTLPLRVSIPEKGTFRQLLASVRTATHGGLAHQSLPFEKIIEAVKPPRSLSHSPLFQVLFVLRTEGDGLLDLPGVQSTAIAGRNGGAKFDVSLLMSESDAGITGVLEYNTDLFDRSTAESLAARYVELANRVCDEADASLEVLLAPDASERQTILTEFNHPVLATGGTVLDLWDEQVRNGPSAIAIQFGEQLLTYAEFDARAGALAGELLRRGVAAEDRVGLYLGRSIDTLAALLGVLKAGAAYVPLDPMYPAERLATIIEDGGVKLILTESARADQALLAGRNVLEMDREWPTEPTQSLPTIRPEHLAYVLFTSGSTGRPKGVAVPHGPAWHLARWQRSHSACNAGTRTLQFTSLNFDVSFQEIFSTWCGGGTLVLIDDLTRRDPDALFRHIVTSQINRLFLPFVALQSLADAAIKPGAPAAVLREVMTAGEQLRVTPAIIQWFASMPNCKLVNQYGPTETHVINTSLELVGDPARWPALPPIGRPIDGSRLYVLDDDRKLLPVGSPGHLYIAGACLARGYLTRPDMTSAVFVPDPFGEPGARMYKTGDLARWNTDGTIQYLGRSDAQVKVQGYRVEPGEIEDALSKYPGVRQTVVMARDDASGAKRLIAYVVTDAPPDVKAMRRHLAATLPAYMVPAVFVRLEQMPLTGSNKVNRAALPEPAGRGIESDTSDRSTANAIEQQLQELWCAVLDRRSVGVHDNYFELGGQSLQAVRLFSRIERQFGRALPLSALFSSPTIAQMAVLLSEEQAACPDGVVIPLQLRGDGPPVFCLAGINGHVFSFRTLADRMAGVRQVYGLQVEGLAGNRAAFRRVEDIAAFLIGHVRRVQPRGPYSLIGYSFGGTVAFEMAQQLRAAGESVALLGMLDTFANIQMVRKSLPERTLIHARRLATAGPAKAWQYVGRRGQRLVARLSGKSAVPLAAPPIGDVTAVTEAIHRVRLASEQALRAYRPQPYAGVVTLFRATQRPAWHDFVVDCPKNGWDQFAQRVDVFPIVGTHLTLLEQAGADLICATVNAPCIANSLELANRDH